MPTWTVSTLEQSRIQAQLMHLGVATHALSELRWRSPAILMLNDIFTGRATTPPCAALVPITSRLPNDARWDTLKLKRAESSGQGILSIDRIGQCVPPGTIAATVYADHRFARSMEQTVDRLDVLR